MFAPKVFETKTKGRESPRIRRAPQRAALIERSFGDVAFKQAHLLQRSIGNQATLRLLAHPAARLPGNESHGRNEQVADPAVPIAGGATSGVSWDFSKIPLYPPDRANQPQALNPMSSGVLPKVARNPVGSSSPVPQSGQLDAPALKEQGANTNSSMQMTTAFAGCPPTFTDSGVVVWCKSPLFALAGQVSVPPAQANGDLTVGFMQAMVSCTGPKGHYYDENGAPYMSAFQPYSSLPLRDADPNGLFYGPEAQRDVDSPTVQVSMRDQPQGGLPWTTPDKKGTLQQVVGEQEFITWLATKSDSTRKIAPLRHIRWSVNWFAAVDPSAKSATPFGVGNITDAGGGAGPMAPIRSGPVCNSSVQPLEWKSWS